MIKSRENKCDYCLKKFNKNDIVSDNINSRYRRVHKKCREEINKNEDKNKPIID